MSNLICTFLDVGKITLLLLYMLWGAQKGHFQVNFFLPR